MDGPSLPLGRLRGLKALDLTEEFRDPIVHLASLGYLKASILVLDEGAAEVIRWCGGAGFLVDTLHVHHVLSLSEAAALSKEDLEVLWLTPEKLSSCLFGQAVQSKDEEGAAGKAPARRILFLLTSFLWDVEQDVLRVLSSGCFRHAVLCSSLSEEAHGCHPQHQKLGEMKFEDFSKRLLRALSSSPRAGRRRQGSQEFLSPRRRARTFSDREDSPKRKVSDRPGTAAGEEPDTGAFQQSLCGNAPREREEAKRDSADMGFGVMSPSKLVYTLWDGPEEASSDGADTLSALARRHNLDLRVEVQHLPLLAIPLLSGSPALPSTFLLSQTTCSSVFPFMLSHGLAGRVRSSSVSSQGAAPDEIQHVRDISATDIPETRRLSYRLLSHSLAGVLRQLKLNVVDSSFAVGTTARLIGNTVADILGSMHSSLAPEELEMLPKASLILVDRTMDLVSACRHGDSLLDRIMSVFPRNREHHVCVDSEAKELPPVVEIFPVHGPKVHRQDLSSFSCEAPNSEEEAVGSRPTPFLAEFAWRGGTAIAHRNDPVAEAVFHSLAGKPAKAALLHLQRELMGIMRKEQVAAPKRKPGQRGRDIIYGFMQAVASDSPAAAARCGELLQIGSAMLEALARTDNDAPAFPSWAQLEELEQAQYQLMARANESGSSLLQELVLTKVLDQVHPLILAQGPYSSGPGRITAEDVLGLAVHAYSLVDGRSFDSTTERFLRNVLTDAVLRSSAAEVKRFAWLDSSLRHQLAARASGQAPSAAISQEEGRESESPQDDWDDWGDEEEGAEELDTRKTQDGSSYDDLQLKLELEDCLEELQKALRECSSARSGLSYLQSIDILVEGGGPGLRPRGLCTKIVEGIINPEIDMEDVAPVGSVVQQLSRVGMGFLSGLSRLRFGGQATASPRDQKVIVLFVVGGITFQEIQDLNDAIQSKAGREGGGSYRFILGSTGIATREFILRSLFNHPAEPAREY